MLNKAHNWEQVSSVKICITISRPNFCKDNKPNEKKPTDTAKITPSAKNFTEIFR